MPATKNALERYRILDQLLSKPNEQYNIYSLTAELNKRMFEKYDSDQNQVVTRTVWKDLANMNVEFGDCINIEYEERLFPARDGVGENQQMTWIHYSNPNMSIFHKPMSEDEEYLLSQALSLLGNFEGLAELKGLQEMREKLKINHREQSPVVLECSTLENTRFFGTLYYAIIRRIPVLVVQRQKTFAENLMEEKFILHPYQLREYNNRWYIMACFEKDGKPIDSIRNYMLDLFDDVIPQPEHPFYLTPNYVSDFFEDIIGITLYRDHPCQKIHFWVSDISKGYADSKPIHGSQRRLKDKEEDAYRKQYPKLEGGQFYEIECRENYELLRELRSWGKEMIVLDPENIREKIKHQLHEMCQMYEATE